MNGGDKGIPYTYNSVNGRHPLQSSSFKSSSISHTGLGDRARRTLCEPLLVGPVGIGGPALSTVLEVRSSTANSTSRTGLASAEVLGAGSLSFPLFKVATVRSA